MPEEGQDQLVVCVDCGAQFPFSAQEQSFYKERGYSPPKRCKACRAKRKAQGAAPAGGAGDGAAAPAQFYKIVCAGCGQESTVPFKPDPTRPAYCRACYSTRRKAGPNAAGPGPAGTP